MIDQGIYTLSEVSNYTKVPQSTLRSWFKPRSDGKGAGPIFQSDWSPYNNGDFAVSFLNLIEAHVADVFRQRELSPAYIRRVHQILKDEWKLPHPFAFQDLRTGGGRIVISRTNDKRLIDVLSKQMLFEHVGPHLNPVTYDPDSRLANSWKIADGVVINPKKGFGKPVVQDTEISTLIIAKQYVANSKNATLVARLFDIPESGVHDAFRFENRLGRIAA